MPNPDYEEMYKDLLKARARREQAQEILTRADGGEAAEARQQLEEAQATIDKLNNDENFIRWRMRAIARVAKMVGLSRATVGDLAAGRHKYSDRVRAARLRGRNWYVVPSDVRKLVNEGLIRPRTSGRRPGLGFEEEQIREKTLKSLAMISDHEPMTARKLAELRWPVTEIERTLLLAARGNLARMRQQGLLEIEKGGEGEEDRFWVSDEGKAALEEWRKEKS